jgi:hypothetical protein
MQHDDDDDPVFSLKTGHQIGRDGNVIPFPRSRKPRPLSVEEGLTIRSQLGGTLADVDAVAEAELAALRERFADDDDT